MFQISLPPLEYLVRKARARVKLQKEQMVIPVNHLESSSRWGRGSVVDITKVNRGRRGLWRRRVFSSKRFLVNYFDSDKLPSKVQAAHEDYLERLVTLRQISKDGYKARGLYKLMTNLDIWVAVYKKLSSRAASMTQGVDRRTIDGISLNRLIKLRDKVIEGKYKPHIIKRVYIPKGKGKKRPLGIPTISDRIIQGVVKIILETVYEPKFIKTNYGFRPNLSQLDAIENIRNHFRSVNWWIEGDIESYFDNIDHDILINILNESIDDKKFIWLIRLLLRTKTLLPENVIINNITGVPQGGLISPLLSNIYLHDFDCYMEEEKKKFYIGERRKPNKEYSREYMRQKRQGIKKPIINIRSKDFMDAGYKRLYYVRYADDFLIGITGSKQDALILKDCIAKWLETRKIKLSVEKTKITHANTKTIMFLGYGISRVEKHGIIRLSMSRKYIQNKLYGLGYCDSKGKAVPCTKWYTTNSEIAILRFNTYLKSLWHYYKLAYNVKRVIAWVRYTIQSSYAKMLASKMKLKTRAKVYKRFKSDFSGISSVSLIFGKYEEIPQRRIKLEDKQNHIKTPEDILMWDIRRGIHILKQPCVVCGTTENVEMHHVRSLKDQAKVFIGRKVIPLCRKHHMEVHGMRSKVQS